MLRVTPVYGSRFEADGVAEAPSCTLIEYGGVKVLWNVGWWGEATGEFPSLPPHDCLIVSDSTLNSLGGLPLYYENHYKANNLHIPLYATFPTAKMGHMTLYDHHASISLDGGKPPYTLEEMDNAMSTLETIKYSQTMAIWGADQDKPTLSITAQRAGHVVGGAFFVLQRLQDETVVVLTPPTYNIAKEGHLDSSTLLKYGVGADVLVTYPGGPALRYANPLYTKPGIMKFAQTRSTATKTLLETILSVLRRDGHVLLPVDASGRVLELVLLLSQHWDRQRLGQAYNLVWLGPMVQNTLDYSRSQLEWMASQLGTQFEDGNQGKGQHPFSLKNVHLCSNVQQLDAIIRQNNNNPTCVLASGLSLDHGPARDLLLRWAENADNAILFTDSSRCFARRTRRTTAPTAPAAEGMEGVETTAEDDAAAETTTNTNTTPKPASLLRQVSVTTADDPGADAEQDDDDNENTLLVGSALTSEDKISPYCAAAQLLQQWCLAKWEGREMDDLVQIDVFVPHRSPLAGPELKTFLAAEEAKRLRLKQQEEKRAMLREVELAKGRLRLSEQEEGNTPAASTGTSSDATKNKAATAITSKRPKKKSRFDSTLFMKFSKPLHLQFEVREEAVGVGQADSIGKYGMGESKILEDDYGISVQPERFTDIVSGVDPSKFVGGSGRIGEEVSRRGFGFGAGAGGKGAGGGGAGNVGNDDDAGGLEDEMDEQAMEAADLSEGTGIVRGRKGRPPTKVTAVLRRLEVLAEVAFVPMEGRVDARSGRQSVRALQPRQVVVLGGRKDSQESELPLEVVDEVTVLSEAAKTFLVDKESEVQTPSDGETAELNVGHAAYSARLVDTPYQTREEKQHDIDNDIDTPEPIEPLETKVGSCTVSLLDTVATGQKVALDGSIVLAPRPQTRESAMKHPSIYISDGEVLVTDLRSELIAQGMKAEYSTHEGYAQLVVNGKILVKKAKESTRLDVEGPLCEDFWTVRGVIAGQYVTL